MNNTKMYILVKKSLPSHKAVAIAHAVLSCYRQFEYHIEMSTWVKESFRKVVCEVTDEEFEEAKQVNKHFITTESGLGGMEVAISFCPRDNSLWPPSMKKYPLLNL